MTWLRDNNTHVNSGVDMTDLIKTDNSKVIAKLESRIAELQAENERLKQERDKRNLEQQAKGVEDFLAQLTPYISRGDQAIWRLDNDDRDEFTSKLRNQAKEQGE